MTGILVRDAEVGGQGRRADVRIASGVIAAIGHRLSARRGEDVIDARGGALLPGLCDHHLHLYALAAAANSVQCGPPAVTGPAALAAALTKAQPDAAGWIRGIGYSEDVAGLLDSAGLDRFRADVPVRIQHRSGALWIVNTAGAQALGLAGAAHPGVERDARSRPTGRLWRADSWLRTRLPDRPAPGLRPVGTQLARLGITHVTDATPDLDETTSGGIAAAVETGELPQHVRLLGVPLGSSLPRTAPCSPAIGPYKIVLADSGLPDLAALTDRISAAHADGRAVAVHCVSREALVLLLAALAEAGPQAGDRLEHGALIPAELIGAVRDVGITVVTQPGFISQRGDDYRLDVPAAEHADLYRLGSLLDSGIGCAISSDAPYGPLDPWQVITAAVRRSTPSGDVLGPAERLTPGQALAGYLSSPADPGGPVREVAVGAAADLVLLRVPLARALAAPSADLVAATIIDGTVVWQE